MVDIEKLRGRLLIVEALISEVREEHGGMDWRADEALWVSLQSLCFSLLASSMHLRNAIKRAGDCGNAGAKEPA